MFKSAVLPYLFLFASGAAAFLFMMPAQEAEYSLDISDKTVRAVPPAADVLPTKPQENKIPEKTQEDNSPDVMRPLPLVLPDAVQETEDSPAVQPKPYETLQKNVYNVRVSAAECDRFLEGRALQNVACLEGISTTGQPVASADYQPDAALVPTDVPAPEYDQFISLSKDYTFPVMLKLKKQYPYLQSKLEMGEIPLISVQVRNGNVWLNGVPVDGGDLESLEEVCRHKGEVPDLVEVRSELP